MSILFEAALTWKDELLAFLPEASPGVRRRLALDEPDETFGLLEATAQGWMLCVPTGAEAEVTVDGAAVDLGRITCDASGERRVPLAPGMHARVNMGDFCFEVRPLPVSTRERGATPMSWSSVA